MPWGCGLGAVGLQAGLRQVTGSVTWGCGLGCGLNDVGLQPEWLFPGDSHSAQVDRRSVDEELAELHRDLLAA